MTCETEGKYLKKVSELVDKIEDLLIGRSGGVCIDALYSLLMHTILKCAPEDIRQEVVNDLIQKLNKEIIGE